MKKYLVIVIIAAAVLPSCVSQKELRKSQMEATGLRADNQRLVNSANVQQENIDKLQANIDRLNKDIAALNNQNGQLGQQTATQQNQLSKTQEELQREQRRLLQLQNLLEQQRVQSRLLKDKMTEALKGFNSNELTVIQKNGKVYVSLSENLLFPSGSAVVNPKGVDALSKLAAVLNLNQDVAVNIEGHTDSIPIRGKYKDNWELSTARSNSIVRILVDNYKVDPVRVIASGHSYYDPVDTNANVDGRARNRRTEIILSPKLDEMYRLLEVETVKN
ncbi:MAG TPA: OmpA family protein [Ferruginibacter sp.]|nr:OmpA family protein [Ferruginibacter sp.]